MSGERKPCGTRAAYQWHLRHEGKPVTCRACLDANTADTKANQARWEKGSRAVDTREIRNGLPFRPYIWRGGEA